jgi:oligopeptide/dipeptide ABC transporter ATP-binding protein
MADFPRGGPLLAVNGLAVSFQRHRDAPVSRALRGVDLAVAAGEIHGLVGESGCGKTVTSTAVMGLLPVPPARVEAGTIVFEGRDLLALSAEERRRVRGRRIAMVFQEPARYLNPSLQVGEQITEMLGLHLGMGDADAERRAAELAGLVGLGGARRALAAYPHELSGGMKQRAMIAMAISCNPRLLIADEPTTALDVTLQLQILRLIVRLRETFRMGILFISHDLRLVRTIADRVTVMYAGRAVESGPAAGLYRDALHPYTRLLLASIPSAQKRGTRLRVIPGRVPDAQAIPPGCSFHPRCPIAEDRCRAEQPGSREHAPGHAAACHFVGKPWPD